MVLGIPSGGAAAQTSGVMTKPLRDSTLLQAYLDMVEQANPEILAQRAVVAAANARLQGAGLAAPAVLAAEAEEVPGGADLAHAGSLRLSLNYELVSGGRRAADRARAAADLEASRATLDALEGRQRAVAVQLLTRAAGWAAITERLADEDSLLVAAEQSLRVRFTSGGVRYVDVLRMRTERLQVESEGAAALAEAGVARRSVEALVALEDAADGGRRELLDSLLAVWRKDGLQQPLPPAPSVDSLLESSGLLRIANATLGRAEASRRVARAELRPRLSGSFGVERFNESDGFTTGPILGAAISLPFLRPGAGRAGAAADSEVAAATAARLAMVAGAGARLRAGRERYEAARARLAVYDAALLRAAGEEREGALASYRSGDLSLLEFLDFERALARAEIDRARSRIDAADALVALLTPVNEGSFTAPPGLPPRPGSSSAADVE